MGLDMYLSKRHYVKRWAHTPPKQQFEVTVRRGGEPYPAIKLERVSYVTEEVAYWRKANAVHRWFVENVQSGTDDCREYAVSTEDLGRLVQAVNEALAVPDPSAVLPTQEGFFFGSTDYDEGYRNDLLDTKRQIEALLKEPEANAADYIYQSSW